MKNSRALLSNKVIVLVIGIVLACLVVFGGYLYFRDHVTQGIPSNSYTNIPNNSYPAQSSSNAWKPDVKDVFIPPVPPQNATTMNPTANTVVQWNSEPIKINDPKLILGYVDGQYPAVPGQQDANSSFYFQLGMHGANSIIVATSPAVDPSGPALMFFEKTPAGEYIFMQKMSTYAIYGYGSLGYASGPNDASGDLGVGYALSSKIKSADTATFYEGLVGPKVLNYQGLTLEQDYLYPADLFTSYVAQQNVTGNVTVTKVASLDQGDLYLYQQPSPTQGTNIDPVNFYIRKYVLRLPSGLYTQYNVIDNFVPQTYTPATITWNDGAKNQYFFDPGAGLAGCGSPGSYVVPIDDISQKIQPTGVTDAGDKIYGFKNINDPVLLYFYHYWGGKVYDNSYPQPVSVQSWYADHPVIVYKNSLGDYTILLNEKYGMTGGCGKPVIYLYPTKTTNVSIQVGASITKSEPHYDNGWQVQASPNGTLKTANGSTYESLFWEGTGHGNYPTIDKGFVVAQSDLSNSLKSDIKQLGLNEKESADFLAFWLPKMPTTPYVRLSWFTTDQMNELAPLVILPRPDTAIRIFLDFQGLNNKISLPVQKLTTIQRKGFTVVEWGGLLRK